MHTNSLAQWNNQVLPVLTARQVQVYNALRELGSATMHQVAEHLQVPLNNISGRFGEMRDKGWILERGTIKGRTVWVPKESKPQQSQLFSTKEY